jgi:heme/copper-type cytochrome/quinol oxidase subunit 2
MRALRLLLLPILLLAQSQPPAPSPAKVAQNEKGKTAREQAETYRDQSIASSISASIDKLTAEVTAWKEQESREHSNDRPSTDWGTIISTIVTALATVAIAWLGYRQWQTLKAHHTVMDRQANYIRDALVETRKAADAATKSAVIAQRAMEISQRAMVSISNLHLVIPRIPGIDALFNSKVEFVITNVGLSMAQNCHFHVELFMPGSMELPRRADPLVSSPQDLAPRAIRGTTSQELQSYFHRLDLQRADTRDGDRKLYVGGFVRYRDVFGYDWRIEYQGRYSPLVNDFEITSEEKPDNEPHQWPPAFT